MVYAVGAITCLDSNIQLHEALPCKTTHVNFLNKISICLSSTGAPCNSILSASCFSWRNRVQLNSPKKWLVSVCASFSLFSKNFFFLLGFIGVFYVFYYDPLQCRMHDSSSSDDEYRSSRNIAISLFRWYRNVVDRGGGANLKVLSVFFMNCIFVRFALYTFFSDYRVCFWLIRSSSVLGWMHMRWAAQMRG